MASPDAGHASGPHRGSRDEGMTAGPATQLAPVRIGLLPSPGCHDRGIAMEKARRIILCVTLVSAMSLPPFAGARTETVTARAPFITTARPQLEALSPGVEITPLITTGDVIGGRLAGYQFSGTPDGIGAYQSAPDRYEVFLNHETSHYWGDAADSRVSHLTLNENAEVLAAS